MVEDAWMQGWGELVECGACQLVHGQSIYTTKPIGTHSYTAQPVNSSTSQASTQVLGLSHPQNVQFACSVLGNLRPVVHLHHHSHKRSVLVWYYIQRRWPLQPLCFVWPAGVRLRLDGLHWVQGTPPALLSTNVHLLLPLQATSLLRRCNESNRYHAAGVSGWEEYISSYQNVHIGPAHRSLLMPHLYPKYHLLYDMPEEVCCISDVLALSANHMSGWYCRSRGH